MLFYTLWIAAVLLTATEGTSAPTCGFPCQMSCYQKHPSEIKAAMGNSAVLGALLPDNFEYASAIREAAATFPVTGGLFTGSQLKGTLLKEATGGLVKVLSACGAMAVDSDKEYLAFKIGQSQLPFPVAIGPKSQEICAAIQVCDGTITVGLRGFKADIKTPFGSAAVGPTAFGLSVTGGLAETSKAPLWFGGASASETKTVNGHIQLAGFLQWSLGQPGILTLNLRADASFIMNLQPDTSQPMVVPTFSGVASPLTNMETLISVGVAPNIEVLNIIRIDLSQFLGSAQASVYLSTLGPGTSFQTAVAFVATVKPFKVIGALGFANGFTTKVIQQLVSDIEIQGKLQFYVTHDDGSTKKTEWGLRLEGSMGVEHTETTKDVKDPKVNAVSVTGGTGRKTTIALWNENEDRVLALSLCHAENNCQKDEYCDLTFGKCTKKVGRGTPCLVDKVCKERYTCVRGFCNRECSKGCKDTEYCDSTFKVCAPKVGKGTPCVEDKVCSGDLVCLLGFCAPGCKNNASCKSDEFCEPIARFCKKKLSRGTACTASSMCQSRYTCVRGFCNRECSKGCNGDEYCDSTFKVCAPKVGQGSVCVEDKVCSGDLLCRLGKCLPGCKNDAACASTQFCEPILRTCKQKLSRGTACTASKMCQSRYTCVRGFCNRECSRGCNGDEYCDSTFKVCAPKVGRGSICVEDKVCKSGLVCKLGSCQSGCRNDAECGTGRFCDRTFRNCRNRVGRGKSCLQSFTCLERYTCEGGFCNRKCNRGCSGSEWCDAFNNCVEKWNKGHACFSSKECKSGKCSWFRCK